MKLFCIGIEDASLGVLGDILIFSRKFEILKLRPSDQSILIEHRVVNHQLFSDYS